MKKLPMPGWIIVKEVPQPDVWRPGAKVVVAESGKEKPRFGVVKFIGSGENTIIEVGDIVYWPEWAGHEMFDWFGNEEGLRALRSEDIIYREVLEESDEDPFEMIQRLNSETMTSGLL